MLDEMSGAGEIKRTIVTTPMTIHTAQMELYDSWLALKDAIEGAFLSREMDRVLFLKSEYEQYMHQSIHHLNWMKYREETLDNDTKLKEVKFLMQDVQHWHDKMSKYQAIVNCYLLYTE